MAEYIDREALLRDINKYIGGEESRARFSHWVEVQPAADVRKVVTCGECRWVQKPEHGKSVDYCHLIERCVSEKFFCAAGEPKTNCGEDMREADDGL